jgi:hypothetical protein
MDAGPLLSVAERYDALRRDTTGLRWAAASAIGGSTGMLSTLVFDAWLAAVAGLAIGLGALRRDRRHGCLPELWPTDPGLYRFVASVRNLQRRGWTVFPLTSGYVLASTRGVYVAEHLVDTDPLPDHPVHHVLRSRCEVACHTARLLTGKLSTRAERVSVHTVVTVNAPTNDPYLSEELTILPARQLVTALHQAPEILTATELRAAVDGLRSLLDQR